MTFWLTALLLLPFTRWSRESRDYVKKESHISLFASDDRTRMPRSRRIHSSSDAAKHKTHAEKLVEEITGKASKESAVQPTSDSDCRYSKERKENPTKEIVRESIRVNLDEKKRTLDAALGKLGFVEVHPLLKKCKSEQCLWKFTLCLKSASPSNV
ncbi:uncharacterized protein LOC113274823 [Papaver somniferum]|uniref:uncharacterized protein LOC113274823 n=1 Tax=Papaver somniferum TaxID=3469 RepID=UPI000E6F8BD7|nr:uncharacterized protein LOC113274823 [Papaver somniferum]